MNRGYVYPYIPYGVSFLFIKIAIHDMSPTALVLIRSGSGFLALALIVAAMRRPLLGEGWKRRILPFAVMGLVNGVLPWFLIAWGEQRISSGMASILNATTPLWAAVLVYWIIPMERPSVINYAGVLIGLAGVVILVVPEISRSGLGGAISANFSMLPSCRPASCPTECRCVSHLP